MRLPSLGAWQGATAGRPGREVNELMAESLVDVDQVALAEAGKRFGTTTAIDTVNAALREAAARSRRARALDELVEVAETGQFDILLDKRTRP